MSLAPALDPKADPATVILDDVALADRWGGHCEHPALPAFYGQARP